MDPRTAYIDDRRILTGTSVDVPERYILRLKGESAKRAKSKKPTREKLVVIDETGTRGHSESYVMTATVVNDRAGFRSIAEVLNPNVIKHDWFCVE